MHYEVSMTGYMGRIANQRKVPKWLLFKKLQVRITKYLMYIICIGSNIHIEQNIYFVDADQFRQEVGCQWLLESLY